MRRFSDEPDAGRERPLAGEADQTGVIGVLLWNFFKLQQPMVLCERCSLTKVANISGKIDTSSV